MSVSLIVSVGGSPPPLIKTIIEHRLQFVCFLCSQQTVELIPPIKSAVKEQTKDAPFSFQDHKVLVDNAEDLIPCYRKARECISKLEEWGIAANDVFG